MKSEKRRYESVVVLDGFLSEELQNTEINKFKELLTSNGAQELQVENWGKKEIKFEVNGKKNGLYICFVYSSENHGIIEKLNQLLTITDSVILFQSHRISDKLRKFKGSPRRTSSKEDDLDSDESFSDEEAA